MNEVIIKYFQNGQYEKALFNLQSTKLYKGVQEGIMYLINGSVCEGLICLSNKGDIEKVRESLREICEQCLPIGFPNPCIPLELELTTLFNYGWWNLSTSESGCSPVSYRRTWQGFLNTMSATCDRRDMHILPPQDEATDLLHKLQSILKLAMDNHRPSLGLCLEITILVILHILLINRDSKDISKQVYHFIEPVLKNKKDYETLHAVTARNSPGDHTIFKFGFLYGNSSVSEIDVVHSCNTLTVLASICSMNMRESERHYDFSLPVTSILKPIWNYVEALKCWYCEDFDRSMGLLLDGFDPNCEPELAARYHLLLGRVYSKNRDRQKAVDEYKKALDLEKNMSVAYYCLGYEFGKMGFPGLMLQHYKKLLKCIKEGNTSSTMCFMLNKRMLELAHPRTEINCAESLYILAVAYGLNEMFDESTTIFQALLRAPNFGLLIESVLSTSERIISLPNVVTVLHEAAVMNLLTGNLSRSEELCQQAVGSYPMQRTSQNQHHPDAHGSKDADWIRKLIKLDLEDTCDHTPCYEDYVYFFDEDIIGLLIKAQLQKIEEREEARVTFNQALLILSKQMARIRKETDESKTESWQPLVKALTCKTCLDIAKSQVHNKPFADVDKMFRRALSCNNGNKDVLYHYAQFLTNAGKTLDAQKLVTTFIDKTAILNVESCQSLALRYLLQSHVSQKDVQDLVKQLGINR